MASKTFFPTIICSEKIVRSTTDQLVSADYTITNSYAEMISDTREHCGDTKLKEKIVVEYPPCLSTKDCVYSILAQ